MNIWSDRIVETHGGHSELFEDDSGQTFLPSKVVKLLATETEGVCSGWLEVKKLLDYEMIWVPENKPLAKKLEALGLTVVMS